MNAPGIYNLGDVAVAAINAATTATVVTSGTNSAGTAVAYVGDLDGLLSATFQVNFSYGSSGGTSIKVIIETSIDQGGSWVEIWRCALTTASKENLVNLSALTPKTTPVTPAALSDDACIDGVLGDRFRARILTVGTYVGNASLSIRMCVR